MKQFRLLTLLALLAAVVSGAWATTPNSIVINGTPQVGDKSISLTYHFDPNNVPNLDYGFAPTLKVKCAADNKWDETSLSSTEVSSGTTNISLSNLGEFEAGKTYEVCFAYNNGAWVDDVFQSFVPAAAGYTVSLSDGVKDADKWTVKVGEGEAQALPIGGLKGDGSETVTLQYTGRLKVKGVKATSDAAPAAKPAATVTTAPTETLLTTITATAKEQASYSTANVATVSFSYTSYGSSAYLANWGWWGYGWIATVTAAEGYTITKCIFYDDANRTATDSEAPFVVETTEEDKTPRINGTPIDGGNMWSKGIKMIEVYGYVTPTAPSGPEVAWNKTTKTGTFTMPGGNVTLEPEYYPQAALTAAPTAADGAKATTDDLLVSGGTVATITGSDPAAPQGTLMYYVSTSTMTTEAMLALDADKWVAEPTAAGITQKCGAFVYYYVKGNDSTDDALNFSDGDISSDNVLNVAIYPAPTYAVTFADGTAEPTLWSASPATDVTKGQTVTVTYTGTKKVIGVKAEKKAKAATPTLAEATAEDYGKVVCAAGHLHDAKTAVPDGCTAVGILGKVTETGHGLILALKDATSQEWNTINGWTSASYAGTTLKVLPHDGARSTNLSSYETLGETTVSNWAVAQKSDYEAIFTNLGSTTGNDNGKTYDYNVNAYITTGVGGTAIDGSYWSATENGGNYAWYFRSGKWSSDNKGESYNVRPVLGF